MDIDLSKYFDTPERERSCAALRQCPHGSNWLYFGFFLIGGFPLLILCVIVWRAAWYVIRSVKLGRPCCLFPDRKPFPWTD